MNVTRQRLRRKILAVFLGPVLLALFAVEVLLIRHQVGTAELLAEIAVVGFVLLGALALLGIWLTERLGDGLSSIVDAAARIGDGDLTARAEPPRLVELERVTGAFNQMFASLEAAHDRLERAEAARQELEEGIRRAHALSVVGQVASGLAHEIGSPLSTILGLARLGAEDEAVPEATRKQLGTIAAQSERITRIVERLLDVAKLETQPRGPVPIGQVVEEVTTFLAPVLRKQGIELVVDVPPELPTIRARRDRLVELVMNLALNAVQAQPRGGAVRVRARVEGGDEPELVLEVADRGPGVPAAERRAIFEPFVSTRRAEGGTGLGLAIVADVARELGGSVDVLDNEGGGALFAVRVPLGS